MQGEDGETAHAAMTSPNGNGGHVSPLPERTATRQPGLRKRRPPKNNGKSTSSRSLADEWNWQRKTRSGSDGGTSASSGSRESFCLRDKSARPRHAPQTTTGHCTRQRRRTSPRSASDRLQSSPRYPLSALPHAMPARAHEAIVAVRTPKLGEFVPQIQLRILYPHQSRGLRTPWTEGARYNWRTNRSMPRPSNRQRTNRCASAARPSGKFTCAKSSGIPSVANWHVLGPP